MEQRRVNAHDAPPAGCDTAMSGAQRLLYNGGRIPADTAGHVLPDYGPARLVWANNGAQVRAADLSMANVTMFPSDRKYGGANRTGGREILGEHPPASTVIITGIYDKAWLLEIQAIAAA